MLDIISSQLAQNVRALREQRRLTQAALAELSSVPRPTIANLESGAANPTMSVLVKVAGALDVGIEALIRAPQGGARLRTAGELPQRRRAGTRVVDLLAGEIPGVHLTRVDLEPGRKLKSRAQGAHTREYLYVHSGDVTVTSGESIPMSTGQVLTLPADSAHVYANTGKTAAVLISLVAHAPLGELLHER